MKTKAVPSKTGPEEELTAEYVGEIRIGDIEIKCAVLSNEKRVFFQREVVGALTGNKKGGLERYLTAKNLEPYVPEKYKGEKWDQGVIKFKSNNFDAHGLEATDLIDICNIYIQARNDGRLHGSQKNLAKHADIIVFKMEYTNGTILPPSSIIPISELGNRIGISFAFRPWVFDGTHTRNKAVRFTNDSGEDFNFLMEAHKAGYKIVISDCVEYMVAPLGIAEDRK